MAIVVCLLAAISVSSGGSLLLLDASSGLCWRKLENLSNVKLIIPLIYLETRHKKSWHAITVYVYP